MIEEITKKKLVNAERYLLLALKDKKFWVRMAAAKAIIKMKGRINNNKLKDIYQNISEKMIVKYYTKMSYNTDKVEVFLMLKSLPYISEIAKLKALSILSESYPRLFYSGLDKNLSFNLIHAAALFDDSKSISNWAENKIRNNFQKISLIKKKFLLWVSYYKNKI